MNCVNKKNRLQTCQKQNLSWLSASVLLFQPSRESECVCKLIWLMVLMSWGAPSLMWRSEDSIPMIGNQKKKGERILLIIIFSPCNHDFVSHQTRRELEQDEISHIRTDDWIILLRSSKSFTLRRVAPRISINMERYIHKLKDQIINPP